VARRRDNSREKVGVCGYPPAVEFRKVWQSGDRVFQGRKKEEIIGVKEKEGLDSWIVASPGKKGAEAGLQNLI